MFNTNPNHDQQGRFASGDSASASATLGALAKLADEPTILMTKQDVGAPRLAVLARGNLMRTPFTLDTSLKIADASRDAVQSFGAKKKEAQVDLLTLIATQAAVNKDSVKHFITSGDRTERSYELPVVVKIGSKHYLYDGTHRAVGDKLLGKRYMRAAVVEAPKKKRPVKNRFTINDKGAFFRECERDKKGHCEVGGEGSPHTPEGEPSAKAERAKAAHKLIGKDVQRYAEEHNEPRFAKVVGGKALKDNEPKDIETDHALIELKTMVDNSNAKITMDTYAQVRKVLDEKETGKTFHTVVTDDTAVYNANGEGKHGGGEERGYYYRRGIAGSARIANLHYCGKGKAGEAELVRLMFEPEKSLPAAARRTDGELRKGRWKAFKDAEGKGFVDKKTGRIVRAKK